MRWWFICSIFITYNLFRTLNNTIMHIINSMIMMWSSSLWINPCECAVDFAGMGSSFIFGFIFNKSLYNNIVLFYCRLLPPVEWTLVFNLRITVVQLYGLFVNSKILIIVLMPQCILCYETSAKLYWFLVTDCLYCNVM